MAIRYSYEALPPAFGPGHRMVRFALLAVIGVALSGCMGTLTYHSAYVKDSKPSQEYAGQALLVMSEEEQSRIMVNQLSDRTQDVELGLITKEVALNVLKKSFDDGVVQSTGLQDSTTFQLAFEPVVANLKYERLVEDSFATERLIPRAEISLDVKTYSNDGALLLEQTYNSGLMRGETCYAVKLFESACEEHDGRMEELQNALIHRMLFDLMVKALSDAAASGAVTALQD